MLPVCLFFASVPSLVRKPLGMLCRLFFWERKKIGWKEKKDKNTRGRFADVIAAYVTGCSSGNKTSRTWRCINRAIYSHKACIHSRRLFVILFTQQPMGWTCCGQELNFSFVGQKRGPLGSGTHVAYLWRDSSRLGLCNRICKHHLCFFFFGGVLSCYFYHLWRALWEKQQKQRPKIKRL